MTEHGPTTEEEMVLAFLRAEINSSRYGALVTETASPMEDICLRTLVDEPNLLDTAENERRKRLLAFRGYGAPDIGPETISTAVFTGFPADARWRRVTLNAADFARLKYGNHPFWSALTDGTRLVSVGAQNVFKRMPDSDLLHFSGVLAAVKSKRQHLPELIAAEAEDGSLLLIEGHYRATAYVITRAAEARAIVASSPAMKNWKFY